MHRGAIIPFFYFSSLLVISIICFQISSETLSPVSLVEINESISGKNILQVSEASEKEEEKSCSAEFFNSKNFQVQANLEKQESDNDCNISYAVVLLASLLFNGVYNSKKFMKIGTI